MFCDLLIRPDLSRTDVLVYGAIVALKEAGERPSARRISEIAGICRSPSEVYRRIGNLRRAGVLSKRADYQVTGARLV